MLLLPVTVVVVVVVGGADDVPTLNNSIGRGSRWSDYLDVDDCLYSVGKYSEALRN